MKGDLQSKVDAELLKESLREIRTALNSALGFLGLLKRTEMSAEQAELVGWIEKNVDSLVACAGRLEAAGGMARAQWKVLVVDDEEMSRLLTVRFLQRLGVEADLAESGREALMRVEETAYDLIFMDIQMPELDGMEVSRRLRKIEVEKKRTRARVVALTAHIGTEDGRRCLEVGIDEVITKPLRESELRRVLGSLRAF